MAASPIDLTTVAAVKSWLGITSSDSDAILQRTVSNVSRFLLSYLSRQIVPADFSERYDGVGYPSQRLVLRQWPVISIASVYLGSTIIAAAPGPGPGFGQAGYTLAPSGDAPPPGSTQWLDFSGYGLPMGAQNIGVTYRAGYQQTESLVIPDAPGPYTVTSSQVWGAWASDEGVSIGGVALSPVASNPSANQYAVNSATGVYTFNASRAGETAVVTYGYVPGDIAQAAIEMIAYRMKSRDFIGLVSKSLGGQESVTFSQKDMPDYIQTSLQNYKRVF